MSELTEKIVELEKQLKALKAQEAAEKEEARKKADEAKQKDFEALTTAIKSFNEKYNEKLGLTVNASSDLYSSIMDVFFPWRYGV